MTDLTNMTEDELMTALKIATDISRDLRVWAATPDPHGMVPIHPETALQIADEIKRLWAERAEAKRYVTMRHGMKGTASLLRMTVKMQTEEIERLCDVERVQDKEIKRLKDALEEIATGHRCNGWYIEGSKAARIAQDAIRNQTDDLYT